MSKKFSDNSIIWPSWGARQNISIGIDYAPKFYGSCAVPLAFLTTESHGNQFMLICGAPLRTKSVAQNPTKIRLSHLYKILLYYAPIILLSLAVSLRFPLAFSLRSNRSKQTGFSALDLDTFCWFANYRNIKLIRQKLPSAGCHWQKSHKRG